jgi:hypothetical protein
MKKMIAVFLCLQVVSAAEADQDTLASALSVALDVKVTRSADDNLVLEGSRAQLERARGVLSNLGQLRQHFLPVSSRSISVTGVREKITSWDACFRALGVNAEEVRLVNISGATDTGKELLIPTDTVTSGKIADIYIEVLRRHSAFFNWVCVNLKECVSKSETAGGTHLVIRYGLLNQFLFMEEMEIIDPDAPASGDDIASATIGTTVAATVADTGGLADTATDSRVPANLRLVVSAPSILKRLIAAGSGDVNLQPTAVRGEYTFSTISLGRELASGPSRSIVDVAIDVSGSMSGEKIDAINQRMPGLLTQFRDALRPGTELMVRVHSFAAEIRDEGNFLLAPGKPITPWKNLVIRGGTDLTLVAKLIPSKPGDGPRVVVGFTDGEHLSSSSLQESMAALSICQGEGNFARPRLCRVGPKTGSSDQFFGSVVKVFAGAYDEHQNINSFCERISADARALLQVRAPVVLDGGRVILWQRDDEPGLFQAPDVVQNGSSITHHGITSTVDVGASVVSAAALVDPRLARLAALRAAQEELEAELEAERRSGGDRKDSKDSKDSKGEGTY